MRKIVVSTMVSIDSVMENPQNWSFNYMSDDLMKYIFDQLFAADTMIMGRVTYEAFAQAWSSRAGADAFADRINALPKFVASRTLNEPLTWNSTLIKGDVCAEIAKLKEQPGQDILQYGCGELTHTLMKHGLIDEQRLIVFPVAAGSGQRIFEKIEQTPMKVLEVKPFSGGAIAVHYKPE